MPQNKRMDSESLASWDTPSITTHLEQLTLLITQVCNEGDYAHSSPLGQEFLSHVSPSFFERYNTAIARYANFAEQCSKDAGGAAGARVEVANLRTVVELERGTGIVYQEGLIRGTPGDLALRILNELQWKVRDEDGRWMLVGYTGLRKPADIDGLDTIC